MEKQANPIFRYIAETGSLMFMPRAQQRSLINTFDSVAAHAHHTAIVAYCLTRMEGLSHEQGIQAIAMAVLHDNAEARTTDLDFIAKHYTQKNDHQALQAQLSNIPFAQDLLNVVQEYEDRSSQIAQCVKDADVLDQLYQEWVLMHLGNKLAERWFVGDFDHRVPHFYTDSAKQLAEAMKTSHPHEWWMEELVDQGINYEHLGGKPTQKPK